MEEDDLKKKNGGKVFVFGASKRNRYLACLFQQNIVDGIFDNNAELWGEERDGVKIYRPSYIENSIIVTAVKDYVEVVRQLRRLNYAKDAICIFIEDNIYENRMRKHIDCFKEDDLQLLGKKGYRYIHVITDQKFVLPTIYSMEKYFNMAEHFFIIYAIESRNENDIYRNWEICKEFRLRYKNIYFVDDYHNNFFIDWREKLHELDDIIKDCEKILFHGEWLCDVIVDYFAQYKEMLNRKAIWIVWSGNAGNDRANDLYIDKMLHFVGGVVCKSKYIFDNIDANYKMLSYKKIYSDFNYTLSVDEVNRKRQKKNVLIGHSCYRYNNILEGLELLRRFRDKIEVYCIMSYGDSDEILEIKKRGIDLYGGHFHAVDEFMPYKDYVGFLKNMDVAFFCEKMAAGFDTLQLLFAMKVKVYLKKDSQAMQMVVDYGYKANECEDVLFQSIEEFFDDKLISYNYEVSRKAFDEDEIKRGWEEVLFAEL